MSKISDEARELIEIAYKVGLNGEEGARFAGVDPKTHRAWGKKLGLRASNERSRLWGKEDIIEGLKRARVEDGIEGVQHTAVGRNYGGLYSASHRLFGSYSAAFEVAFGFPFSKGAIYLARRIRELRQQEAEIIKDTLAKESARTFRRLIRQGYFNQIYGFATVTPEVRKRTRRDMHLALTRMILNSPDSVITPETVYAILPPYRKEAGGLLVYGMSFGLLGCRISNGTAIYQTTESAISKLRDMWKSEDHRLDETIDLSHHNHDIWWKSVRDTQTPEGKILRHMEKAVEGLPGEDNDLVFSYFTEVFCNPDTYNATGDTYKPNGSAYRRGAIVADVVNRFRYGNGIPPALGATLRLLPPNERTIRVFGMILMKPVDDGHNILRDISAQTDAESAYNVVRHNMVSMFNRFNF